MTSHDHRFGRSRWTMPSMAVAKAAKIRRFVVSTMSAGRSSAPRPTVCRAISSAAVVASAVFNQPF
jgi:hypothetical protein